MSDDTPDRDGQRQQAAHRDLPASAVFREVLRSRLVRFALLVAVLGGGLWVYGAATRSPAAPASTRAATPEPDGGAAGLVNGLQSTSPLSSSVPASVSEAPDAEANGLAESLGPKLAGGGVSFVGAYGLGWLFRRFLKLAAILTGLGIAGVAGLSGLGVLSDDDLAKVRGGLDRGGTWVQDNAGAFKDRALAVLPSSAAALGGLFVGFRRK